jgi:hypothetical protein
MAIKLARPDYAISRIDQPEKKHHGWFVRIQMGGSIQSKFFSDSLHKGKEGAHKAAKKHRDGLIAELPPERQATLKLAPRKVPSSGTVGVTHVVIKNAAGEAREFWQAAWKDALAHRRTKKFAITEHGPRKALKLAKDYLAEIQSQPVEPSSARRRRGRAARRRS